MSGWYWWVLIGLGVAIMTHVFFPQRRGLTLAQGTLVAVVGALVSGFLTVRLGGFSGIHWLSLLSSFAGAVVFLWPVRLFSPRRLI